MGYLTTVFLAGGLIILTFTHPPLAMGIMFAVPLSIIVGKFGWDRYAARFRTRQSDK